MSSVLCKKKILRFKIKKQCLSARSKGIQLEGESLYTPPIFFLPHTTITYHCFQMTIEN